MKFLLMLTNRSKLRFSFFVQNSSFLLENLLIWKFSNRDDDIPQCWYCHITWKSTSNEQISISLLWKVCSVLEFPSRSTNGSLYSSSLSIPGESVIKQQAGISSPRRLITIYKGHRHLKIFRRMTSLRKKSRREV